MKYDFAVDMSSDNSLSLILRRIRPGTNVLEFGPAKGYMTAYLKHELGCKVYGVELDSSAAEVAKQFTDVMIVCDVETLEWKDSIPDGVRFDHIIFADVLEHLRDPVLVLKEASQYLEENGTVLTSIPNVGHAAVIMELLEGRFDYRSLGLLDNTHLRFFTRRSVESLFEKAELEPIEWCATLMVPEHTELKQDYRRFPKEIQEFLQEKQDAHVYQFITVAKKNSGATIQAIESSSSYAMAEYVQLFWSMDGEYSEERSIKVPILSDAEDTNTYRFDIPSAALHYPLRLDPANFQARINLERIELRDYEDEPIVIFNSKEISKGAKIVYGAVKVESTDSFTICSLGLDPQILISLKNVIYNGYCKVIFNMRIKKISDLSPYIDPLLQKMNDSAFKLEAEKTFYTNRFIELESIIQSQHRKLNEQSEQIAVLNANILELETIIQSRHRELNEQSEQIAVLDANILELESIIQIQHRELNEQSEQNAALKADIIEANKHLSQVVDQRDHYQKQLIDVQHSFSWRLTAPVRWLRRVFKSVVKTNDKRVGKHGKH